MEGLREHGYVLGQNLVIECRWSESRAERASALAAELVSLKLHLIIATSTLAVRALKQVTSTIPIVIGESSTLWDEGWSRALPSQAAMSQG